MEFLGGIYTFLSKKNQVKFDYIFCYFADKLTGRLKVMAASSEIIVNAVTEA